MKNIQKHEIQSKIDSAKKAIEKVWYLTNEETPEEAIVESMLSSCYALRKIINSVKTED